MTFNPARSDSEKKSGLCIVFKLEGEINLYERKMQHLGEIMELGGCGESTMYQFLIFAE
jgi:hypothetical protein